MGTRARILLVAAIAALIVLGYLTTRGMPAPTPTPEGSFAFAALGDAPYYVWEEIQFRLILADLQAHDLEWVLHVGDLFWHPCSDRMYRRALGWLNGLRHPVVYTPGDNEWADCWEPGSGRFAPIERLGRIRSLFFADPARSLGGAPMPLVSQAGREPFAGFVENARWTQERFHFATLHVVGSANGQEPFPGRSAADDAESSLRMQAAIAWMRETFSEATSSGAAGVVLAFHASPVFEEPVGAPDRRPFEPLLRALEEEAARFSRPILVVHGDDHEYIVDHPLVRRATGRLLQNVTRLEVPGSPEVGWVKVVVTPGAEPPFSFEPRVVSRWTYW